MALAALGLCGLGAARASQPPLALSECRLEHPLHVVSIGARCAGVEVPEERGNPASAMIKLHVAIVPALNRRSRAAPLVLLAGGPGQGAADMYVSTSAAFARINRDHDIVLVDQRGTGGSHPLNCDYTEDWQAPADPLPQLRRATQACLAKLGPGVRFYTSSAAVADLDAVRAALQLGQIDLYAASYGTRVAQLYMRRYPQHVHAAILDGVTFPEQAIGPDTPFDGDRALDLIMARCRQAADCAAAFPDLGSELNQLLSRFGRERVSVTLTDPSSGLPRQLDFTHALLAAALRFLSYSASQAALLPTLIHQAARGALAPLAAQTVMNTRQISAQLASGMPYSVICSEDVPFFGAVDRAAIDKTFQGSEQIDALAEICRLWPKGPVDPDLHKPLRSDVPTLLLSGEADPVTPPASAERAARTLMHKRHLVLAGEGHGQLGTGCVPRLMAEFLESAAPEELNTDCLRHHAVLPFFVSMTGPAP